MTTFCPKHNCPMVRIGAQEVCLLAYAEGLVGKAVVDLAVDDGLTVLILQGNAPLPLPGWKGNARAASDEEDADGLLEVLDEMYLVGAKRSGEHTLTLHLGDHPGGLEASQWMLDLNPSGFQEGFLG